MNCDKCGGPIVEDYYEDEFIRWCAYCGEVINDTKQEQEQFQYDSSKVERVT